jgi:Icc-related predicted phosphoesterase
VGTPKTANNECHDAKKCTHVDSDTRNTLDPRARFRYELARFKPAQNTCGDALNVRLLSLCLAVMSMGCPDKKPAEAKPEAKVEAKPTLPPPPPVVAQPRAEKECAAPIDPAPAKELKLGSRSATQTGARLTFGEADADGQLVLGVLGPVNEDSGANMLAIDKYAKFFADEKVDAIVVTGDVGELSSGIARVLTKLAASKLPVLVIAGNSECRAEYTDGVNAAMKEASNIVNMNEVRVVEFPELTLVSLPGHFDPEYIKCATGCRYYPSTIEEVAAAAKQAKSPVALVSHGPPRGKGEKALDVVSGNTNVGDEAISTLIADSKIAFGFFSNIKEAGGRAVSDVAGATLVKEGEASPALYVNPGPADATTAWDMNDGSKGNGMAAAVTIKDGRASYKLLRLKAMSAAEKAAAKKLDPKPTAPAPAP